jgi:anion-transporting  ArsA/GET3 family ATPase
MRDLLSKRIVLITGKGGVGRSTVAAALAHVAHREGKSVLLTEMADGGTDYSALAKLFGLPQLPATPGPIAPGIHGSQLLAEKGAELFLASVINVASIAKRALGFEPLRKLSMATPSLRELGVFFHLLTFLRAERAAGLPRYDLVVVDMPATGHTLALTGLPEVILRLIKRGPIADAMREGQSYLNDPRRGAAYVVTLPETLPISEALELVEGLERTSIPRGGLIVNRVPTDAFSEAERRAVEAFIRQRAVLGGDAFARVDEARAAIDRLGRSTSLPWLQLPASEHAGAALVEELALALRAASFRGPGPSGTPP